jgi:ABC-2 type transport system ATP-binding protein
VTEQESMMISNVVDSAEPGSQDAVVVLKQVSVWYGSFQALDEVTLRLPAGATGLVGRNGAGKSTLLRLLLGLLRTTRGTGAVLGIPLSASGPLLRRAVGYMPENDAFLPGMKAIEQVALAGELCSLSRRESIRRAHEVLGYTGLGEARYRNVEGFSTGMKQRLKLAVALVHDPSLVLLDEPTVGLDPPGRRRMLDLIEDLVRSHGKSLVISTHLLGDIQDTCDTVVMLERGRVMASGRITDVLGSGSKRYRMEWQGSSENFIAKLRSQGVEVEAKVEADTVTTFDGQAVARLPVGVDTRAIFDWAADTGVRIRLIEPEIEELGDLYHRLLDRENARAS